MSETPRTEEAWSACVQFDSRIQLLCLSRNMERELTAMTEERDELREQVRALNETILDQENHIMELERLRRYSPGPHMGQD